MATNLIFADEAGFEVLVGTEESRLPSQNYSEKAYVMSKSFIKQAISNSPQGLEDVIHWLYLHSEGPNLLRRVVEDSKMLLIKRDCPNGSEETTKERDHNSAIPFEPSAGALILLKRHLASLENHLDSQEPNMNPILSNFLLDRIMRGRQRRMMNQNEEAS